MTIFRDALASLALAVTAAAAAAEALRVEEVPSVTARAPAEIASDVVAFSDRPPGEPAEAAAGFVPFEEWGRARPVQQQLLGLYPGYREPVVTVAAGTATSIRRERLYMYVAEARFALLRPAVFLDLSPYVSVQFLERVDPAISHRAIAPAEVLPPADGRGAHNRDPARPWCEWPTLVVCVQSHYRLEGKLPLAIRLANKLRVRAKPVAEAVDFQSELRLLAPGEIDHATLRALTGLDTPLAGGIVQSIFHVNQIMEYGKLLALVQADPDDAQRTLVTIFVAIAVKASLFELKKEFEKVPVLKNLIPAQVLLGKSSFNTGNSISSGLPNYTRSHIKAIAEILRGEQK